MSYKTIIVHLDAGERSDDRLALGASLAESFGAHLIGAFAVERSRIPAYGGAEVASIVSRMEDKHRAEAMRESERRFLTKTAGRAISSEWRALSGEPVKALCDAAICADLLVVGQSTPDSLELDGTLPAFAEEVVIGAGKPVLLVPYIGPGAHVGRRTLAAWKPTREAARALADGLPFLRLGDVDLVTFEEREASRRDETARADVVSWLKRQRVQARVRVEPRGGDVDIGELILSRAADAGADLIVMGAYGHSPLRELLLGGATRTVLRSMTVPVLMSH